MGTFFMLTIPTKSIGSIPRPLILVEENQVIETRLNMIKWNSICKLPEIFFNKDLLLATTIVLHPSATVFPPARIWHLKNK
jgi:hypothetical protein